MSLNQNVVDIRKACDMSFYDVDRYHYNNWNIKCSFRALFWKVHYRGTNPHYLSCRIGHSDNVSPGCDPEEEDSYEDAINWSIGTPLITGASSVCRESVESVQLMKYDQGFNWVYAMEAFDDWWFGQLNYYISYFRSPTICQSTYRIQTVLCLLCCHTSPLNIILQYQCHLIKHLVLE